MLKIIRDTTLCTMSDVYNQTSSNALQSLQIKLQIIQCLCSTDIRFFYFLLLMVYGHIRVGHKGTWMPNDSRTER